MRALVGEFLNVASSDAQVHASTMCNMRRKDIHTPFFGRADRTVKTAYTGLEIFPARVLEADFFEKNNGKPTIRNGLMDVFASRVCSRDDMKNRCE